VQLTLNLPAPSPEELDVFRVPIAIFADVHSNLEALEAVLADMESLKIRRHICLGDIVGYGPNPGACLKRIRSLGCPILQGNHDWACTHVADLDRWSEAAQAGIAWSRLKLTRAEKEFLATLPLTLRIGDCEFVHASLESPGDWNYILTEDDAHQHFQVQAARIAFCGHTHLPLAVEKTAETLAAAPCDAGKIRLRADRRYLINVGSVGQPRDRCPHACYAIYRPAEAIVEFRRVPYDVKATRRKILRARLPQFAADRLEQGI
jgi:diadenosine tetraphosphatase ApaH/serine/threonine PP2A family protein phosphatase